MRLFRFTALGLVLALGAGPALAQMQMGSSPGLTGGHAPQPQARTPDIAPPALPGAGAAAPLATGPKMQQPASGDPTAALFTAVNKGDYNGAQDALSRGADLNARDQFGETPLDLSISLNRNTITFLLLQTRNELGEQDGPAGQSWTLKGVPSAPAHKAKPQGRQVVPSPAAAHAVAPKPAPHPAVPAGAASKGTPNPQAGFLGFGPKN